MKSNGYRDSVPCLSFFGINHFSRSTNENIPPGFFISSLPHRSPFWTSTHPSQKLCPPLRPTTTPAQCPVEYFQRSSWATSYYDTHLSDVKFCYRPENLICVNNGLNTGFLSIIIAPISISGSCSQLFNLFIRMTIFALWWFNILLIEMEDSFQFLKP